MMPKSVRRGQTVLLLALLVNLTSMSVLLTLAAIVWNFFPPAALAAIPVIRELGFLVLLVAAFAFIDAALRSLTLWHSRRKAFRLIAVSRFAQAATTVMVSVIAVSFSAMIGNGLIVGIIAGSLAGATVLLAGPMGLPTSFASLFRQRLLLREARAFINYPKFSLGADLINALAWRLPVLVFPALFGMAATGQLSIAYRVIGLPSQMIGQAFLDVFRQKATEDFGRSGSCLAIFMQTFKILISLSVVIFVPLAFIGADLFALVFGAEWAKSGEIAQTLSVMFAAGFVASPLAFVLYIANRQSWDLAWQSLFASGTVIALAAGAWANSPQVAVTSLATMGLASYLLYFGISYRTASQGATAGVPNNEAKP